MTTRGFDWAALMRLGLRDLHLDPDTFWALTPQELALMAGLEAAPAPMTRARLSDLLARYPDQVKGRPHDPDHRT
jgi:uncharacterized phage protein (TIGR02216 family)